MKKRTKNKLLLAILFVLFIVSIGFLNIYKDIFSWIGIKSDKVVCYGNEKVLEDIQLYYIYTIDQTRKSNYEIIPYDTIIIFSKGKQLSKLPSNYGKTKMLIKYKNKTFQGPWHIKLNGYSKHTYKITFHLKGKVLIADWNIYGKYCNSGRTQLSIE